MRILVLGNGFDLAHELPTSYMDFLRFIELMGNRSSIFDEKHGYCERKEINKIRKVYQEMQNNKDDYTSFQHLINDNKWIEYFFCRLEKCLVLDETWQGFENDIYDVICIFVGHRNEIIKAATKSSTFDLKVYEDYELSLTFAYKIFLEEYLDQYTIMTLDNFDKMYKESLETLEKLILALELYLSYVNTLKVSSQNIFDKRKYNKVLNFNYTNTYERCYLNNNDSDDYIDYIHGNIGNDESSDKKSHVVLGIDDELPYENKERGDYFNGYKKYFQRIFKRTGCKYLDWFSPQNDSSISEFVFYGHSFSFNDRIVLMDIFKSKSKKIIVYHDNKSLGNYIYNIERLIGSIELTRETADGTIQFVPIEEFH